MNPLQKASEYLFRENGWGKHYLRRNNRDGCPSYCMVGAINAASRGNPELRIQAKQVVLGQLCEQYPDMFGEYPHGIPVHESTLDECLIIFNDSRRTKDPVIRILQKAALEWPEF